MKIRQPLDYPDSNEIEPAPPEVPVLAIIGIVFGLAVMGWALW